MKRNVAIVIAAIVVVTASVFAIVLREGDDPVPRGQARPSGMAGMDDTAGMDMSSGGDVMLSAGQLREFGVTFDFAELRTLAAEIRTVGIVNFDETRLAQVVPKVAGYVERLYVDFTGRAVTRGQPLLEIYSPDLVAAQEELLLAGRLAESMSGSAVPGVPSQPSNLLESAKLRLRSWDISQPQIDEILRTGRVRRTLTLFAPVGGVVLEKNVLRGQAVQAGQTLYTIADLARVWIEAELREGDVGVVQEGGSATVELAAFPGRPLTGTIEYIYPTLQADARTLKARIAVPNPGNRLKPGMYATVRLTAPMRTALTVPASAIVRTGERTLAFTDMGNGRIVPQEVVIGRTAGELTEVLSGVEPGQRVVTSAQFLLDSESNLGEVMRSMIGTMGR
jgi:multidrug efflux pump subunit AcrA (membrane-fusion protein)